MNKQTIEITNKFTGAKTHREVAPAEVFKALGHFRKSWNVSSAKIVCR